MARPTASPPPLRTPAEPVRLDDVAREAGVSLATVDRVLNGRAGVREGTVQRVQAAVDRLAYQPNPAAARLARQKPWRLAFVLPQGTNSFVAMLNAEIEALTPWLASQRAHAGVTQADAFAPQAMADALAALRGECDAAVVMAQDHPLVRDAIDGLADAGASVVTLVSDVPARGRAHFVGIDNVAAGRTAGSLLGRFSGGVRNGNPGRVGIVMGSHSLRDHADRLFGFQQVMRAEHGAHDLLPPIEGHDRSDLTEPRVQELLQQAPGLVGLYSIGAGNRGIHAALKAAGAAGRVVWVCHELTPHARRALLEGTASAVIHQSPAHEVRSACRVALSRLARERLIADQERIRIEIYLKDNLP
ncbi:MAG TPA: LacI family DNA-binding transcriptional regulator [Burkholderiaceae bacterium]|nr:LacI family DNA-binding transcriptional regulator [Burkholderiaceae bacterium]